MIIKYLRILLQVGWKFCCLVILGGIYPQLLRTQTVDSWRSQRPEIPPPQDVLPSRPQPQPPSRLPKPLPAPDELLKPSSPEVPSTPNTPNRPLEKVEVKSFVVSGSTVFSQEQIAKVLAPFVNKTLSFPQLLEARSAITQLYIDRGFITSGAYLPPQRLRDGIVKIQVIEGILEDIQITGTKDLNPNYIRSRLVRNTAPPLNRDRLLESLQLLQQDPLIESLSAELSAGGQPGTSRLELGVTEADSFDLLLVTDNGRSPSVGTFRRRLQLNEANLFGIGDGLGLGYSNTDGSDGFDINYDLPLNSRDGTLQLAYGETFSDVIEPPFEVLNIESESSYYQLTLRQPLVNSPTQEFSLGLTASRQESNIASLVESPGVPSTEIAPAELSPGADNEGDTKISALRFSQEWTTRSDRHVLATRSQLSFGVDAFDATTNDNAPDSDFFAWQGQGQWIRLLAKDTSLLLRANLQLADQPLVPLEQIGIGGSNSVRGYRQDVLLADNGAFASAEVRLPILQVDRWQGVLQVTPFVEFGTVWNSDGDNSEAEPLDSDTLASTGLGLLWQQGDRFTARFDWGIPLISVDARDRTWQEDGLYFSLQYNPW